MKNAKIIISIIVTCILLLSVNSLALEVDTNIEVENYTARTYIDNPVEGQVPSVKGILEINGWYLSDDEQAQIEVLIDDVKQEIEEITREDRQDVLDTVSGYGGIEKNPQPGYKLKVDISKQKTGDHELKVNILSRNGEILATDIRKFSIESYKAKTYIETPAERTEELVDSEKLEYNVDGWVMTDDIESQLKIYIDGKEQEIIEAKRIERKDVISAITGFGSQTQNPTPGYSLKINLGNIIDGKHELRVKVISREGIVIAEDIRTIKVEKYKAKMYLENPYNSKVVKTEFEIGGWVMSTDANTTINAYIDGQKQEIKDLIRKQRDDVISSITGYGDSTTNPTPGFEGIIQLSNISEGIHSLKIEAISSEGVAIATQTVAINVENYKAKTYIETPAEGKETTIDLEKLEFNVDGWVMTDDIESQLKIYIDGREQEIIETKRIERKDVISAITGFGSQTQNPTPGYSLKINLGNIIDGKHELRVKVISREGTVITEDIRTINVEKYKAKINLENPYNNKTVKPEFEIGGWIMSTDENVTINAYIDGQKQEIKDLIRKQRDDVINSITGYGDSTTNPEPGFEGIIQLPNTSEGVHTFKIEIISQEGTVIATQTVLINLEDYKTDTYIETPQQGSEVTLEEGLRIDGWVMTEQNIDIKLYIDNEEIPDISIERLVRDDVIDSIGDEYGGIEANPTPGFSIPLNIEEIPDGSHTATIKIFTQDGQIVATSSTSFIVNKYVAKVYIEVPEYMEQSKATMLIGGWLMSTDSEAQINIYINNQKQEIIELIRKERQDVIDGTSGYGGAETNPEPGFEAEIDISKYDDGIYELKVESVSREGKVMSTETRGVVIYNKYDLGIDVSKHNGSIDWTQVKKSGIQFAIIRAGYRGYGEAGNMREDLYFVENMRGAIANGIKVGVYYYSQAITVEEAIQEAEATLRMIQENGFTNSLSLPVVIDTEASGGRADSMTKEQRTTVVKAFCERIKQAGYTPMVYSNKSWLKNNLIMSELEQYEVWVAHYTNTDDPINNPTDYQGRHEIWQYTSTGSVPGVNGNVDRNISYKKYF